MLRLSIVAETPDGGRAIAASLESFVSVQCLLRCELPARGAREHVLVDIDLLHSRNLPELAAWLKRRAKTAKAIFAIDRGIHHQEVQAYAIGATDLIHRPLTREGLLAKLVDPGASREGIVLGCSEAGPAVATGTDALHALFSSAGSGGSADFASIGSAGETIASHIGEQGLAGWIDAVRKHHSQTYQHCLLVTGVAVGFGRKLGFSGADQKRLAIAGLLHDVGKARIPLAILEKPGPLDARETEIMRQHPVLGVEALGHAAGLDSQMLDMVVHHHEYLDGSGYPHGLCAEKLSDLVRIMTISDIFGALMERRSYKPPLSSEKAYDIIKGMGPKLDPDLVREFRKVADMKAA